MSIAPIDRLLSTNPAVAPVRPKVGIESVGFGDALAKALTQVSDAQKTSGALSKAFLSDNPTVTLEQTMVAGVKSGIAFQVALQVRNKMVQAYSEVMNTQV